MTLALSVQHAHGPTCHTHGIRGYGDPRPGGVMCVGIAPGVTEVKEGKPLVGPSGELLAATFNGLGWPWERVYRTNLLCWRKDEPTPDEIAACASRLAAEIDRIAPFVVLTLGRIPAETFFPGRKLTEVRGGAFWVAKPEWEYMSNKGGPRWGYYVLPTYHPAGVLRGYQPLIHDIVRDVEKIPRMMTWPRDGSYGHIGVETEVITDPARAQAILDSLPIDRPIGIDIETATGEGAAEEIDVFSDRLLSISVSTGKQTWAWTADVARALAWPLTPQWTMHNGMFDAQGIRRFLGVPIPIKHDTMLMSYNLDERGGRHGLKGLAKEYVAAEFYAEKIDSANLGAHTDDEVLAYNGADAAYTARLAAILLKKQADDGVLDPYYNLLLPAANAFTEISLAGVAIDEAKIRELSIEWFPKYIADSEHMIEHAKELGFVNWTAVKKLKPTKKEKDAATDEFDWASHPEAYTLNLHSPKQLSSLLYDVLHLPPPEGSRSTNKKALDMLAGQHPFIDELAAFRKLDQVIGNYILGLEDDIRKDGRLHPNVLLHGTRTGRLSYRKPPLQTIPQDFTVGGDLARVREIFVADSLDHVIIQGDYSQCEVWVAAYLSHDTQMISDLQGGNYHRMVAAASFNVAVEHVTEPMRQLAKKITFGILYGSGASGLAVNMRCDVATAQLYIDRFRTRYHVYDEWYNRQRTAAIRDGELVGPTGRKRRFLLVMGSDAHKMLNQAVNTPVQGGASDVGLSALIELHRRVPALGARVLLSLHDANYVVARRDRLDETAALMHEVMTAQRFPTIPSIPCEFKYGDNLGQMTKLKIT